MGRSDGPRSDSACGITRIGCGRRRSERATIELTFVGDQIHSGSDEEQKTHADYGVNRHYVEHAEK
jgi:hypothetical protein